MSQPTLTPDEFREVMGRFASGVTVITAVDGDERFGTTASAVSSLSLEPPMLLCCLASASATAVAIAGTGRFAVNILGEDHSDLAIRFATRDIDKFSGVETVDSAQGVPLLAGAIATLECEVSQTTTGGTHHVFLAEVRDARGHLGAPLAYFRGQFGRLELAEDAAAARAIRERVLQRQIPVGEPLDITALAEEIKAPRGSVYHALAKLLGDGWVGRDADGAFVVPPVTHDALIASARARIAIFVGAAQTALPIAPPARLSDLRRLLERLDPPGGERISPERWFADRTAMVECLMDMTGSGAVLLDAFNRADVPAQIHSFLFGEGAAESAELRHIHLGYTAIVEACAAADQASLAAAVKDLVGHYDGLYRRSEAACS